MLLLAPGTSDRILMPAGHSPPGQRCSIGAELARPAGTGTQ